MTFAKITTTVATLALVGSLLAPAASANNTIGHNGSGSLNTINNSSKTSNKITQTSSTFAGTFVSNGSNTGMNTASGNTGKGTSTITTGGVTNHTGSGISSVTFNIYDSSNPGAVVSSAPGVIDSCVSRNTSPGGGCLNGTWTNSSAFPTANMVTGHSYFTKATATDAAGNTATSNPSATYDYDSSTCVGPYLKTGSGDVHSNQNINTPGGP